MRLRNICIDGQSLETPISLLHVPCEGCKEPEIYCNICARLQHVPMGELTTAVEDDEIISHFKEVLVPFVLDIQGRHLMIIHLWVHFRLLGGNRHIVSKVEESLTKVIKGMTEDELLMQKYSNRTRGPS